LRREESRNWVERERARESVVETEGMEMEEDVR